MRQPFVHEAVVELNDDSDPDAPGAAITTRLCGSIDHPGPCPLAPHNIHRTGTGPDIGVRVVFVTEPDKEQTVRDLIRDALRDGRHIGPDRRTSSWRLELDQQGTLREDEQPLAKRLADAQ